MLPDWVVMASVEAAVTNRWPFTLPLPLSIVVKMTRADGVVFADRSGCERCWPGCFRGSSLVATGGGSIWFALDLDPSKKERRPPPLDLELPRSLVARVMAVSACLSWIETLPDSVLMVRWAGSSPG